MRRPIVTLIAVAVSLLVAGCAGGSAITMPNVVGKGLDVAISDVKRAGINKEVEVLGGGMFGIVDKSNWIVCSQEPQDGAKVSSAPRLKVDRTCASGGTPSEGPTQEPKKSEPKADAYSYKGPKYEIVSVDKNQGPAKLTQHWVYTGKLDYSTSVYKDQIKMIIADIAHAEGTDKLLVEVVTDKEIAQAESPSTFQSFVKEHGSDYAKKTIPEKEKTGWVASYTGGFDPDTGEASDSAKAFEVIWFIAADAEIEKWKPEIKG